MGSNKTDGHTRIAVLLHALRTEGAARAFEARVDPSLSRSVVSPRVALDLGLRHLPRTDYVCLARRVFVVPVGIVVATAEGHLAEPLIVGVSAELAAGDDVVLGADWAVPST